MTPETVRQQNPAHGAVAAPMIFIVGNSRSGTTMLGRMFGRHSRVFTFDEIHFFEQLVDVETVRERAAWDRPEQVVLLEKLLTRSRCGFFEKPRHGAFDDDVIRILDAAGGGDALSIYAAFLRHETRRQGKGVPCEQTPRYLFSAAEILDVFPQAVMINMVRDPRDVLLSQKNKWRRRFLGARNIPLREAFRSWANYHPYVMARLWGAAVRQAERMADHPRFVSVRFETLLAQPRDTLDELCRFAGLQIEAQMLEVPQIGSSSGEDHPERIGVNAARIGAWQQGGLQAQEIATCQRVAGAEMQRQGYAITPVSPSLTARLRENVMLPIKGGVALMLNLHRTKNLFGSLRRRFGRQER